MTRHIVCVLHTALLSTNGNDYNTHREVRENYSLTSLISFEKIATFAL